MIIAINDNDNDMMREANIFLQHHLVIDLLVLACFLWSLLQGDCDNDDDCEGQISVVSFQISMI